LYGSAITVLACWVACCLVVTRCSVGGDDSGKGRGGGYEKGFHGQREVADKVESGISSVDDSSALERSVEKFIFLDRKRTYDCETNGSTSHSALECGIVVSLLFFLGKNLHCEVLLGSMDCDGDVVVCCDWKFDIYRMMAEYDFVLMLRMLCLMVWDED
jgi:hypothetical protein